MYVCRQDFSYLMQKENRMLKQVSRLASLALVGACLGVAAPAHAAVISGTLVDFASSADLDLTNIVYAVNLGSATSQTVGGVTFDGGSPAGFTLAGGGGSLGIPTPANLDGGGTAEDALEAVLADSTFATDNSLAFTFDTDEGTSYRLQLLMYDTVFSVETRNFDISVDGNLVVDSDGVSLGTAVPEVDSNLRGRLYTLDFVADSDETQVTFAIGTDSPGVLDPNPIINGVTLATAIPEPASLALCLLGMIGIGLGRQRLK